MSNERKIEIKVCGMRDYANIMDIASLLPQYFGFIFYPDSPRFVGNEFRIPPTLPSSIKRVGVFVDESNGNIISKSQWVGFDHVQLHGNESPKQCHALRKKGLKVIKVFSVDDDFNFDTTQPYKKEVDYFLFDTKGKLHGGNAKTFNWNILTKYDQEIPFFLSGGLSPENVHDINDLKNMNLHALDLNSGVEVSPGIKSKAKVEQAIRSTRYARGTE
jgi:phosphoribosylanthranilate isomerase